MVNEGDDFNDENDLDEWVLPPQRRHGTFLVFDFEGAHDRVPELLELTAAWLRGCAEYQLEQIAVRTDEDGWSVLSVTVQELRPGDLMEALTAAGQPELAAHVAALVKQHGTREGLRRMGLS